MTVPAVNISLDQSQINPIASALETLNQLHRGPASLKDTQLSIEPKDVSALIGLISKSAENEMAIFRFKKAVTDLILSRIERSKNQTQIDFYQSCIDHIQGTKVGQYSASYVAPQRKIPTRVDLLT